MENDYLKILLISESKLKSESVIDRNISARMLSKTIKKIQNEKLFEVLGTELYDDILQQAYNKATIDGYVLSDSIIEILDEYIQPYLIHYCYLELIDILEFQFTNKGIKKKTDSNSSSISQSEILSLRNKYENDAIIYKSKLIDYLVANNLQGGSNDLNKGSFEATGVIFDDNFCPAPVKKTGGIWSGKAWSPTTVFENYDGKLIKKITGYVGGEGELPEELTHRIGMYFSENGLVFDKNMALDFRGDGSVDKTFEFEQSVASDEWFITHNLGKKASVTITDTAHSTLIAQIVYVDNNNVILKFNLPVQGYAFFN